MGKKRPYQERVIRRAREVFRLSRRLAEAIYYASKSMCNVRIGEVMGISPRTVEGHLAKVYVKMGVRSRVEAVLEFERKVASMEPPDDFEGDDKEGQDQPPAPG